METTPTESDDPTTPLLNRAQEVLNSYKKLREDREAERLRNQRLEAQNQQLEARLKKLEEDRIAEKFKFQTILNNLQSIFDGCTNDTAAANPRPVSPSPAESTTGKTSSASSSGEVNSANSSTIPSLPADTEAQKKSSAVLKANSVNEIGIQTEIVAIDAGVREKNNQEVSAAKNTNSEAVSSRVEIAVQTENDDIAVDSDPAQNQLVETVYNNEIASDTNDISNYFSSFYVEPQTTEIYAENTSTPVQQQRMILSNTFETSNKRCLTIYFDDQSGTPNVTLVQHRSETNQSVLENENTHFMYTSTANEYDMVTTVRNDQETGEEGQYYDDDGQDYQIPVECDYKPVAKKRARGPINRRNPPKKKSYYELVTEDSDSDYVVVSGQSSTSDCESDYGKSRPTFKVTCKICESDKKTRYFTGYRALDRHLMKNHPFTSFPTYQRCPYGEDDKCTRHYLRKSTLLRHIESNHPNANSSELINDDDSRTKSWECAYCGGTFLSGRLFKKHMDEFHPGSAETKKVTETPTFRPDIADVKIPPKTETPKKRGRKPRKLTIKKKEGKFFISDGRKLSVSSVDDDYDPDAVSIPIPGKTEKIVKKRRRRKSTKNDTNMESDRTNSIVVRAEIHETKTVITQDEETPPQPTNSTKVTENEKSQNNSQSADIDEFVLSSINEIPSIIDKQQPPVATESSSLITANNVTIYSQSTQVDNSSEYEFQSHPSFMISALPCLLEDCPGCDYHPKPTIIGPTLDDEYVSSCRDEILADLYSIPDNAPMATDADSFTADFSFPSSEVPEGAGEKILPIVGQPNTTTTSDETVCDNANDVPAKSDDTTNVASEATCANENVENDSLPNDDNTVQKSVPENAAEETTSVEDQPKKTTSVDAVSEIAKSSNVPTAESDDTTNVANEATCANENDDSRNDEINSVQASVPATPENAVEEIASIETDPNEAASVDTVSEIAKSSNVPTESNDTLKSVACEVTCAKANEISPDQTSVRENTSHETTPIGDQSDSTSTADKTTLVNENTANFEIALPSVEDENGETSVLEANQSTVNDDIDQTVASTEIQTDKTSTADENTLANEASTSAEDTSVLKVDQSIANEPDKPTVADENTLVNEEPMDIDESVHCGTALVSIEDGNQKTTALNENQLMEVDVNDRITLHVEIPSSQDPSNVVNSSSANRDVPETVENSSSANRDVPEIAENSSSANDNVPEIAETASSETSASENQNEIAKVDDQNNVDDTHRACDLPSSTVDEEPSAMEVDNPEFEECYSSQINLYVPESDSDTSKDLLQTNDAVSTNSPPSATKTTFQKSIFDPDNDYVPATPDQTEPTVDVISSSQLSVGAKSTTPTKIPETTTDISSTNVENHDSTNLNQSINADTPLNLSTSNVNSTFYDEFDLVQTCEVETCNEKDSTLNTPSSMNTPCSVSSRASPLCCENRPVADPVILKHLLNRNILARTTNEIIDGVQIEIEIGDSVSSHSSVNELESIIMQSSARVQVEEESRKNDDSIAKLSKKGDQPIVETPLIRSSAIRKKLTYPVVPGDPKTPEFSSLIKRMLTEKSLGIGNEPKSQFSLNLSSPSSTSGSECNSSCSCSGSSCSSANCSVIGGNDNDDHDADQVPPVESGPPHSSPIEEAAINEKEGYEIEAIVEAESKSPPVLSPMPPSPIRMSPNSTTQPDQSHNSIEVNAPRPENQDGGSSPLITSSNQRVDSDLVFDLGSPPYDISGKTDEELFTIFKLNMFRVVLTRVPVEFRKPTGPYGLRRQTRVPYAFLNSPSLPYFRRQPCISSTRRMQKKRKR